MTITAAAEQRKRIIRARDYLRVSLDRSGRARSLEEQHADHERVATEQGWTLGESYRDESVSASRYSRKTRDDFDRLISDLDRGEFDAEVLMIWESSRGSRRVGEWVNLLDLCERRSVCIRVHTHNRTYCMTRPMVGTVGPCSKMLWTASTSPLGFPLGSGVRQPPTLWPVAQWAESAASPPTDMSTDARGGAGGRAIKIIPFACPIWVL